jgi:hypothetical protein
VYCFYINLDLGPFATKDPRFPLPGNMNIDVNMRSETFQMPENQQSLASAFLDVETNEVNKHQVLAQFLRNTKTDDQKRAKEPSASKSKEMFESAKVQFSFIFLFCFTNEAKVTNNAFIFRIFLLTHLLSNFNVKQKEEMISSLLCDTIIFRGNKFCHLTFLCHELKKSRHWFWD